MRRRAFITLLGGAAAWPLRSYAQQPGMRRIGALMPFAAEDRQAQARYGAFLQGLQQAGWSDGRNLQIVVRWGTSNADLRRNAAELVALAPDVIFTTGSVSMAVLAQTDGATAVPTVFALVPDPVGAGYVASLARPGGNVLLREIRPGLSRAGIVRDATVTAGIGQWAAIQAVAPMLNIQIFPVNVRDVEEIERAFVELARTESGGAIVTGSFTAVANRDPILTLAARHRVPAIYYDRYFALTGGLLSYGPDSNDIFRRASGYIDRVLKGEKPADLPVQAPTKFELVINLKAARVIGIELPASLIARADEVIE